jgi:hypothetical protein
MDAYSRHSKFGGLRQDKDALEVVRERLVMTPKRYGGRRSVSNEWRDRSL